MSRALLRGFITAVGMVVMVQQSILLLGLGTVASEFGLTADSTTIQRLLFLVSHFNQSDLTTSVFSVTVLGALMMMPTIKSRWSHLRHVPEVLVVVVMSIVICQLGRLDQKGLDILGRIGSAESGFNLPLPVPSIPQLPRGADIKVIIVNAAIITIIGFVESIAAAKTFARKHNYFVSANRELVALGMANIFGGVFQAFPSFGSVSIYIHKIHCLVFFYLRKFFCISFQGVKCMNQ